MNTWYIINVFVVFAMNVAQGAPSYCKCHMFVPKRFVGMRISTGDSELEMKTPCVRGSSCQELRLCLPWSTNQIAMENLECCCRPEPGHYRTRDLDMYRSDGTIYFNEVQKCQPVECGRF
ncbi:hypothetical protein MAR_028689 [Mya arenaria]|uniref:Uncharacterized protein n=1 Tax=Mya arenaria TaxID=6604 RepID=A0ABY7DEA4_MYAAR|nr:hypothetical protein MAR_028689 [Mya arenaria]